jgi:titin
MDGRFRLFLAAFVLMAILAPMLCSSSAWALSATPVDLVVVPSDGTLQISWSVADAAPGSITEFWLYLGKNNESMMLNRTIQGKMSCTLYGLVNGAEYCIAVRAVKDGEVGPFSETVRGTPRTVPNAPLNLEAIRGDRFLTITWTPPSFDGGANISGYRIYEVSGVVPAFLSEVTNQTWFVHTNLIAFRSYSYQVSAINAAGEGNRSLTLKVSTDISPGAPKDLNAVPGVREIKLTWVRPASNGGSSVTGYIILRGESEFEMGYLLSIGLTETYTDKGIPDNTTYYYSVMALNDAGQSEPCMAISAHTLDVPHPILHTVMEGSRNATIIWTSEAAPGAPTLRHWIMRWTNGSDSIVVAIVQSSGTYVDSGLQDGLNYTYWIEAENIVGRGVSRHIEVIPRSPPSAPANLTTMPSEIYTILQWTVPYNGGSPILGYEVRLREGGNYIERQVDAGQVPYYLISGLVTKREYLVNVRAYNEAGAGDWSADLVLIPGRLPGTVQDLTGTSGDASVSLSWKRPTDSGTPGNFTYYIVRTLFSGGERVTFNTSSTSFLDTGLINKATYRYYVYARNDVGLSNSSADIAVVPKKPGPELGAPTNLKATNNSFSVRLTWTAPASGLTILGYYIYRSINETGQMSYIGKANKTEYTDTSVVLGVQYDYFIKAYNVIEDGLMSSSVTAHPQGETQDWLGSIMSLLPYVLAMVAGIAAIIFFLGKRGRRGRRRSKR